MYPSRQNFRKKALLGKRRVKKGDISKKKRAQVYRLVASAGQPTFPCRSHFGSIVTVVPSSLWLHRRCGFIVTVFCSSLNVVRHCNFIVTAVPWSLWFHDHCGSMDTVVPWLLWFHSHCGSMVTMVP